MQNGTAGEKINDNKKDDARKNVPETTNGAIGYEPEMGTGRKKFINDIKRLGVILLFLVLTLWQFSSLELFFKQTINNFNTEFIIKNMLLKIMTIPKIIRSGTAILRLRTFPLLSKAILIAVSFFSSLKFIQYLTTKLPPLLFTVL